MLEDKINEVLDKFYLNCVEMVKRNIVLLNNAKDVEDYDRMMGQRAINPQDLIEDMSDLYKAEAKQAILQHFQQEQEKAVDELRKIHKIQRDCGSLEDQYMLGLYNGLEMALSIAEDREPVFEPGKKKEPTYTQSEVDRLIREARIDELENLPLQGLIDQCFIAFRRRLDKRFKELSKQKEGSNP